MAQDTSAIQQQLLADPQFQQLLAKVQAANQQYLATPNSNGQRAPYLNQILLTQQAATDYALSHGMPKGYVWDYGTNQIHQDSFTNNHPVLTALGLGGAAVAAPYVFGALAGGGAAAGSAGAAGAAGTLPATTTVGATGALAPAVAPATDIAAGTTAATAAGAAGAGGSIFDFLKKYGSDIGGVLTNAAASNQAGNLAAAGQNARAIAENNQAKVEAAKYNLALPSVRANQTARGEILNTMQDAPLTGDPRIDKFSGGGLRPSAFGPQARQAGALEASTALNALQNPSTDRLTPQEIPPYNGSTLSNVLGGAGLGADIFSLLAKYGGSPRTGSSSPTSGTNQTGAPIYDANGNVIGYGD